MPSDTGFWATVGGWIVAAVTLAWSVIASMWAGAKKAGRSERTDQSQENRIEDHELRLRNVESERAEISEIKTDVKWIKAKLAESTGN